MLILTLILCNEEVIILDNFSKFNLKINEDILIDVNNCRIDGEFLIIDYNYKYLDKNMKKFSFSNIYVNIDVEDGIVPIRGDEVIVDYIEEEEEIIIYYSGKRF